MKSSAKSDDGKNWNKEIVAAAPTSEVEGWVILMLLAMLPLIFVGVSYGLFLNTRDHEFAAKLNENVLLGFRCCFIVFLLRLCGSLGDTLKKILNRF